MFSYDNDEIDNYTSQFNEKSFNNYNRFLFNIDLLSLAQTDEQLRNPEFLVDQYNQLVAKHNALIEKTRHLISEKSRIPSPSPLRITWQAKNLTMQLLKLLFWKVKLTKSNNRK